MPITGMWLLSSDLSDQNVYILYICVVYAVVLCLSNAISLVYYVNSSSHGYFDGIHPIVL